MLAKTSQNNSTRRDNFFRPPGMPSLPCPPSPRYYFNKLPEVSVKGGSRGQAGQLHGCRPALPRGSGQPRALLQLKSARSAGMRMVPLVLAGTDPDSRPSRLQPRLRCWRAGLRGGQNGLGGCAGGPLALPSHVSSPSCHPALHGHRCWLPSLPHFCLLTMRNKQPQSCHRSHSAGDWMRPLRGGEALVQRRLRLAQPSR